MSHGRTYFSLDIVLAAASVVAVLLALAWGRVRHAEERDKVALTLAKMNNIVHHWNEAPDATGRLQGDAALKDGWGRRFLFDDTPERTVISLGADGLPGGEGYNADLRAGLETSTSETR